MATSTYFGWTEPDDTDLVKNGAAAMRTLGNAIDSTVYNLNGRNPILNSNFSVWQRGTSFSLAASAPAYTADRWYASNSANQALTISRQTTSDTTNLPNIQYALRFQRNSGQTGTADLYLFNNFESVNSIPYAGKTVTFSFYARKGTNYSATSNLLGAFINTGTGTDQGPFSYTSPASVASFDATLTTTWQRFSATGTIGTNVTQMEVVFKYPPIGTAGAADYFEITGVQIDIGSVALPYKPNASTYQGELAACQRYYYRASQYAESIGMGSSRSATVFQVIWTYPQVMRTTPTISYNSGTNYWYLESGANNTQPSSPSSATNIAARTAQINFATTGMTAGQAGVCLVAANPNNTAYLEASAEL